jgi:signal transduction histidine kinase
LDLSALLTEVVGDFQVRFPSRRIHADIQPGLRLLGDRLLIVLAVNNLVENAIRYSPVDTSVGIVLQDREQTAVIRVSDEGPGIPDDEKKRVFERFYRMGAEEKRRTKGTGLGLHLTRKIVEDHRGGIRVEDNLPVGSTFVVHLPKSRT